MEYGTIWSSEEYSTSSDNFYKSYNDWYTDTTDLNTFDGREKLGRTIFAQSVSNREGITLYTQYRKDHVDAIYIEKDKVPVTIELKYLNYTFEQPRYQSSQLYENIKKEAQVDNLHNNKGMGGCYIRYWPDAKFCVNVTKIDWNDYVTIDNPSGVDSNNTITEKINEVSKTKLVRCHNWFATASTVKDPTKKTQKDVWFIPNEFGRLIKYKDTKTDGDE